MIRPMEIVLRHCSVILPGRRPYFTGGIGVHCRDADAADEVWPCRFPERGRHHAGGNDRHVGDRIVVRGKESCLSQAARMVAIAREREGTR